MLRRIKGRCCIAAINSSRALDRGSGGGWPPLLSDAAELM
jgi:hypothetical protein